MVDPQQLEKYEVHPGNLDGEADNAAALSGHAEHFAPSRPALHPKGIVYRGPYETPNDGICVAVRRHARALSEAGVHLFLRSASYSVQSESGAHAVAKYCELDPDVLSEVAGLTICSHETNVLAIQHISPTIGAVDAVLRPRFMSSVDPNGVLRVQAATILFCAWERDRVDPEMARLLNLAGGLWVPCQANKRALERSGVTRPIDVIPHPHYEDDPILSAPRQSAAHRPFRFLHVGKWEPRKDQHAMMGGFLKWFSPTDNVELVLKTKPWGQWKDYPKSATESLTFWLSQEAVKINGWTEELVNQKIKIISAILPRYDPQGGPSLVGLYGMCDAYVSSGHGEGFDLPAYDAKLSGMPMIFCKNTGPEDFCSDSDVRIFTESAPCHPYYGWDPECRWEGYDEQDIGCAMRAAFSRRGLEKPIFDRSLFTSRLVGKLMRDSCERLITSLGGDPKEILI